MRLEEEADRPEADTVAVETAKPQFALSGLVCLEELRGLSTFGTKDYTDAVYEGELIDGKRHGKGVMKYNNGRVYEGEWVEDMRQGRGFEKYSNGNTYEGMFLRGKAHGRGVYTWSNGETYDGEWRNGLKYGNGVWKGVQGDTYMGGWRDSKAEGYGVHVWKTGISHQKDIVGDRYEGEWRACLKHGKGTDYFANGDVYTGEYINGKTGISRNRIGKPWGFGEYTWKNGSHYAGYFQRGLKHGWGKWRRSKAGKCNTFEGEYSRDVKQGFGVFHWASNNIYRGQYANDERDGIGEMTWVDGSRYVGQWVRGIQHGFGRMIFPDGTLKEGLFENNIYKGPLDDLKDVPEELLDPRFDVMSLAPSSHTPVADDSDPGTTAPGSTLSATRKPRSIVGQPLATRQSYAEEPRSRTRVATPGKVLRVKAHHSALPSAEHSKYRERTFARQVQLGGQRPRAERWNQTGSFSRCLSGNGQNLNQSQTGRVQQTRTMITTSYRNVFMKTQRTVRPKRSWIPSGKVHYVDETSRLPVYIKS